MIGRFKARFLASDELKRLWSSVFSLGVLQISNYVLALAILPFLVRVLGAENYGLLAFVTATVAYFGLLTDYGFNLSATRQVSLNRDAPKKIDAIYSAVLVAKFGLFFASLALLSLLIFSFDIFRQNWGIYHLSFGLVLGQTLFPVWLFQGMERMKYIAYPNIWAKLAIAILIFALVREKEDYWMVPALFSSGYIAVGFYALYIAKKKMGVRFSWPSMGAVGAQLKDGYHVFLSGLATNVYTVSSTFILGLFTNNLVVGHFAAAEKLIQAINGLYLPVSQALYPFLNKKIENDRQAGLAFVRKVAGLVGGGMTLISALLFIFAPVIVRVMFGAGFEESVLLLRILAVVPVFVALGNVLGIHIMLNIGFKRAYSTILLFAAMLAIGMNFAIIPAFGAVGAAVTRGVVEGGVVLAMVLFLRAKSDIFSQPKER